MEPVNKKIITMETFLKLNMRHKAVKQYYMNTGSLYYVWRLVSWVEKEDNHKKKNKKKKRSHRL